MADVNHLEKIPSHYQKEVVQKWIKGDRVQVVREILNPSNYCVVTFIAADTWSFYRFFNVNGKTQVSKDWSGNSNDAVEKLIENYSEEHNY